MDCLIDHIVVDVRDRMAEGAACFRKLGFQLTPMGRHSLGSTNHLAILGRHYLELLGTDVPGGVGGSVPWSARAARGARAPIAQPAEAFGSNPIQCGFESHSGHHVCAAHVWHAGRASHDGPDLPAPAGSAAVSRRR